jgi:hypothetical protein
MSGVRVIEVRQRPFWQSDFTDGSVAGSDPYDNPHKQYQQPAPWSSAIAKAKAANDLAEFLSSGTYERDLFTEDAYAGLNLHMFGHIAEFSIHGFFNVWFETPEARAKWVRYARNGGAYGFHDLSRPRLWGDVERKLVEWLDTSGVGDRLIEEGRSNIERRERAQLRELLAKYPDER